MTSQVPGAVVDMSKGLVTDVTGEVLLARMHDHVSLQTIQPGERLGAHVAVELFWFLALDPSRLTQLGLSHELLPLIAFRVFSRSSSSASGSAPGGSTVQSVVGC